jgi:hypothetical protein
VKFSGGYGKMGISSVLRKILFNNEFIIMIGIDPKRYPKKAQKLIPASQQKRINKNLKMFLNKMIIQVFLILSQTA